MAKNRNSIHDFARRAQGNFDTIYQLSKGHSVNKSTNEYFEITQLLLSALAAFTIPYERNKSSNFQHDDRELVKHISFEGIKISDRLHEIPKVETYSAFVEKMRHALSHGNIQFRDDERIVTGVYFWNVPPHQNPEKNPDWVVYFSIEDLKDTVDYALQETIRKTNTEDETEMPAKIDSIITKHRKDKIESGTNG